MYACFQWSPEIQYKLGDSKKLIKLFKSAKLFILIVVCEYL